MIVLGISGGHDANWSVVRDGVLLGAFEKERFTARRHDSGEVMSLIPETLAYLGLTPGDIDMVATSEPVHRKTESGLRKLSGPRYARPDEWVHQIVEWCGRPVPCVSVAHHVAHAAYARYTGTGEGDVAVITWDGGGDFYTEDAHSSTTISHWHGGQMAWLERIDNADFGSLWFIYSKAVFGDGNHAGKLMGLAALGGGSLVEAAAELFLRPARGIAEGVTIVKNSWPDEHAPPFVEAGITWKDDQAREIAAAVQAITTHAGLSVARGARAATGSTQLALSGGVALNGYLNTAIRREGIFDDVHVPPAVNDGGISVGAALFATHHVLGQCWSPNTKQVWDYNGMGFDSTASARALDAAGLEYEPVEPEEAEWIVGAAVAEGQVAGWFEGRAEHGPRALGHRSIIGPAFDVRHKDHINDAIKFRESFRPLAPAVPSEMAATYFDMDWKSPWMMYIVDGTERCRRDAPGALHVDGTARVQTVDRSQSLGRICDVVGDRTGTPIVLNTSLNVGTPIVNSPDQAVDIFHRVPIDLLYADGHLVRKRV